MAEFKLESTGVRHTKRVVRDGVIIGIAGQMSDDRWRAYDTEDRALTIEAFQTPNGVLKWFKAQSS